MGEKEVAYNDSRTRLDAQMRELRGHLDDKQFWALNNAINDVVVAAYGLGVRAGAQ